jgi:hypothetical protein
MHIQQKGIKICKQHWDVVEFKPSKIYHPHHLQRWVGEHVVGIHVSFSMFALTIRSTTFYIIKHHFFIFVVCM